MFKPIQCAIVVYTQKNSTHLTFSHAYLGLLNSLAYTSSELCFQATGFQVILASRNDSSGAVFRYQGPVVSMFVSNDDDLATYNLKVAYHKRKCN